jgi:hypothetical protein
MKSKPAAPMLHVLLKGSPLLRGVRRVVEPHDNLNPLETLRIQIVPIRGRLELKVVSLCRIRKERQCLLGKVNVVAFDIGGVKRKNVERRRLRKYHCRSRHEREDCEN